MVTVVAALIEQSARMLICQRSRNGSFPLSWEFPGGKVEPGESLPEALARELREELGVASIIGAEQYRTRHSYAHQPELADGLELVFFLRANRRPAAQSGLRANPLGAHRSARQLRFPARRQGIGRSTRLPRRHARDFAAAEIARRHVNRRVPFLHCVLE